MTEPVKKSMSLEIDMEEMPLGFSQRLVQLMAEWLPFMKQEAAAEGLMQMCSTLQVVKALDADLRQATYVVLEADSVDLHGDTYSAEEVAKACHNFNEYCRKAYIDHAVETEQGKIVESYIAPVDMQLGEKVVKQGTWLAVMQFDTELWQEVKKGVFTGLSIGAYVKTEEIK